MTNCSAPQKYSVMAEAKQRGIDIHIKLQGRFVERGAKMQRGPDAKCGDTIPIVLMKARDSIGRNHIGLNCRF